ncbi:hypothetical protein BVELS4_02029 [Bacillus velezensis]|nr:hypothetical protein BVELS4_02029 [Bacillus velezensis]
MYLFFYSIKNLKIEIKSLTLYKKKVTYYL